MARSRAAAKASKVEEELAPSLPASLELDSLIGYNLRRAHAVQKQRFAAVFGPFGIRPVTLSVLAAIRDHPNVKPAELGELLNIKRANMVPLLAELGGRGLIARRQSMSDRRAQLVTLTGAGKKLLERLLEIHGRLEGEVVRSFGAEESQQLLRLLKKFRQLSTDPDIAAAE